MSTCISVKGSGLRSVLVHIKKRKVDEVNCVRAVGSGDNLNATVTLVPPCFPSSTSTMASGGLVSSLASCICRHNVGGLDQGQRFAHDIERKVIGWMQFSRLLQLSYRLGK